MGLPNIGPLELIIILAILLLVVGPKRLPSMGRAVGETIRDFRKASSEITDSVKLETKPSGSKDESTPEADAAPAAAAAPTEPAVSAAAATPAPAGTATEAVAETATAAESATVAESAAVDTASEPEPEEKKTDASEQV
jgi:sec-independent protein translocase protein TatA